MNMTISEPVIDFNKLDHIQNQVFLDEFVDLIEESTEELLGKLEQVLVNHFDEFKGVVHSINGLSGNISASRLCKITSQLESMSEEDYTKNAFKYSSKIIDEVFKVRKELEKCALNNG